MLVQALKRQNKRIIMNNWFKWTNKFFYTKNWWEDWNNSKNPDKKTLDHFLSNVANYEEQLDDSLKHYYMNKDALKGFTTKEGTEKYAQMKNNEIP